MSYDKEKLREIIREKNRRRKQMAFLRKNLFLESYGRCYYCQMYTPLDKGTIEHKQPRSKGGTDIRANLEYCCIPCNASKGNKTEEEYKEYLTRKRAKAQLYRPSYLIGPV